MAVVLDVNVLVSAAISGVGPSASLVAAVRDGLVTAIVSPRLLAELRDVLARDRLRRFLSLEEADSFIDEIGRLGDMVDDPAAVPRGIRDPGDEYVVALAVAAGADAIVSGDLDLREAPDLPVAVITPRDAVETLLR